jgi:hypothetical protein
MGLTLAELRQAMSAYTAAFDAAVVPPGRLGELLSDAGAIERMASTLSCLVAARLAGGAVRGDKPGLGGRAGSARAAAQALARSAGTSLGEARRAIEAGQAMADQPEVAAAARAGELSRAQAALVSGAAGANPGATERLLGTARNGSLGELADQAGRARAAAEDLDQRRANVRAGRSLREWTDPSGTWQLHARGLPEDGARVMAALAPLADRAFEAARKQDRREAPEAYAFDALVALAGGQGGGAPGYEVMVRVDHSALVRGYALDGETCELAGFGPVSPQVVLDIMEADDPFLKAIATKGKDVVGVAHLGRRPNAHQRSALDWLYPSCAVEGCGVRSQYCQTDHRTEWATSHVTVFDLLDRLCKFHHDLKTYQGWGLVQGHGKRAFVHPEDPRHPRHGPPGRDGPPPPSRPAPAPPPAPSPPPSPAPAPSPAPTTPAPERCRAAPPSAHPRLL